MEIKFDISKKQEALLVYEMVVVLYGKPRSIEDPAPGVEIAPDAAVSDAAKPAPAPEPEVEPTPVNEAVTVLDIQDKIKQLVVTDKNNLKAVKDLLKQFGVEKVGALVKDDYPAFMDELEKL